MLRILTELAYAIDDRGIPIDYRRRRDLAASTTLIDDDAWARMTREAGMRLAPAASARRYLYELLTGCGLVTAPPPYRLSPGSLGSYNDFALGIPACLAAALAGHARRLLDGWGIGGEPLQWQPPDEWVTVTAWPVLTPRAPILPPSTGRCWTTRPRPSRSRRNWASPWATCVRCCAGIRCPGPADRSVIPSSPRPTQPHGLRASSPA